MVTYSYVAIVSYTSNTSKRYRELLRPRCVCVYIYVFIYVYVYNKLSRPLRPLDFVSWSLQWILHWMLGSTQEACLWKRPTRRGLGSESWNMPVFQWQTQERIKTSIDHPTSLFQHVESTVNLTGGRRVYAEAQRGSNCPSLHAN